MTCKVYVILAFLPMDVSNYICTKCKLIKLLEEKVEVEGIPILICENEEFLEKTKVCVQTKHSKGETAMEKMNS